MEFPELGKHCAFPTCSRLDFLPFECDACHQIFCKDHGPYEKHACDSSYAKDARVPVCPLCNQPVPVNRGEDPNAKVNMHIQNECKNDKSNNISNRCSVPGCKKKELVPVTCTTCRKNFCLKHRFETDHDCQGHPHRLGGGASTRKVSGGGARRPGGGSGGRVGGAPQKTAMSKIGAELNRERMMRLQGRDSSRSHHSPTTTTTSTTTASSIQPHNMAEDDAVALAIAASVAESSPHSSTNPSSSSSPRAHPHQSHSSQQHKTTPPPPSTLEEDEALARAIAASLIDQDTPKPKPKSGADQRRQNAKNPGEKASCTIS
jgi:predicted nucleic acid binding AN1-type Zn finger protein